MDKELQKVILEVITAHGGESAAPLLRQKVVKRYWKVDEPTDKQQKSFLHQLKLLENDGAIQTDQRTANIYYVITSPGYLVLSSWHKRLWYFILYDKHNLLALLALIVSIVSIIVTSLRG